MDHTVLHFEIPADNPERARETKASGPPSRPRGGPGPQSLGFPLVPGRHGDLAGQLLYALRRPWTLRCGTPLESPDRWRPSRPAALPAARLP